MAYTQNSTAQSYIIMSEISFSTATEKQDPSVPHKLTRYRTVLNVVTYHIIACNVTHAFSQCRLLQMRITASLITFQTPHTYLYLVKRPEYWKIIKI
jgi:hypothetical protein